MELDHQFQIPVGKALLFRQFILQGNGEPGQHSRPPTFQVPAGGNHAPDVPIQEQHFQIRRQRGALLRLADAGLDFREQVAGDDEFRAHCDSPSIMVRMRSVTPLRSASISASGRGGWKT